MATSEHKTVLIGQDDLSKTVKQAEKTIEKFGKEAEKTGDKIDKSNEKANKSTQTLKKQLRDLQKQLGEMKFNGLDGSEEFQKIAKQAGNIKDALSDAQASVRYFADDVRGMTTVVNMFQGVAGAISLAQGAVSLFSGENKAFEATMKKVAGAMAVVNGVQSIANMLNKDSNLIIGIKNMQRKLSIALTKKQTTATVAETTATKGATLAQKALNAVLKANPIGIVITAVGALVTAFSLFSSETKKATTEVGKLEDGSNDLSTAIGRQNEIQKQGGEITGELLGKFENLRIGFMSCKTEMEKQTYIKNMSDKFYELGLEINTVDEAVRQLVSNAPDLRRAYILIAQAEGIRKAISTYTEQWSVEQAGNPPTKIPVYDNQTFHGWQDTNGNWTRYESILGEAGINSSHFVDFNRETGTFKLDPAGVSMLRNYSITKFNQEWNERQAQYLEGLNSMTEYYDEAARRAEEAAKAEGLNWTSSGGFPEKPKPPKKPKKEKKENTPKEKKEKAEKTLTELEKEIQQEEERIKNLKNEIFKLGDDKSDPRVQQLYAEVQKSQKRIEALKKLGEVTDEAPIEALKKQIGQWEKEREKLLNANSEITDQTKWDDYTKQIEQGNKDLQRMQDILDGVRLTKFENLKKEFDEVTEKFRKALEEDPALQKEETKNLKALYDAKKEELDTYQEAIEKAMEIQIDPKESWIKEQIKALQDAQKELQNNMVLNPNLNLFEKGRLQNQIDEYKRQINKYTQALNQYKGVIEIEPVIEKQPWETQLDDVGITAKNKIEEKLKDIDWAKAAEGAESGFGLNSIMGDNQSMLYNAQTATKANIESAINEVVEAFDAGLFTEEQAKSYIETLNEYLQNMGLEPIPIDIDNRKFYKEAEKMGNTVGDIAGSLSSAFGALGDVMGDDSYGANVAKIVAQAVATLALSFAKAMADAKTSSGGIWTWIAGGITGMATLLTMTAQLKNAQKFAEGGIVGGTSMFGDKLLVRVNSGEAILNGKQQRRMFDILDGKGALGNSFQHAEITWRIKGGDLYGALRNYTHIKNKTTNIKAL